MISSSLKKIVLFSGISFFVGMGMLAITQDITYKENLERGAVQQVFLAGNKEGRVLLNTGVTLVEPGPKLSELPKLADPEATIVGRYEIMPLGDSRDFVIFDSQTGVARAYYESGEVFIYNAVLPNHVVRENIQYHEAGESIR